MNNKTKDLTIEERLERLEDFALLLLTSINVTKAAILGEDNEIDKALLKSNAASTTHGQKWGAEWLG